MAGRLDCLYACPVQAPLVGAVGQEYLHMHSCSHQLKWNRLEGKQRCA